MTTRYRQTAILVVGLWAAAFGVVGCDGDDAETPSEGGAEETASAEPTTTGDAVDGGQGTSVGTDSSGHGGHGTSGGGGHGESGHGSSHSETGSGDTGEDFGDRCYGAEKNDVDEWFYCDYSEQDAVSGARAKSRRGLLHLELVEVQAPFVMTPAANSVRLRLLDAEGNPLSNAAFTCAQTWTFAHTGHDAPPGPELTPTEVPGEYDVSPVYFAHGGQWHVLISAEVDGVADDFIFTFCIDESYPP